MRWVFMTASRQFWPISEVAAAFFREEDAQDLVEYALLAAFIGTAGYLALMAIAPTLGATYGTWLDPSNGVPSLWAPIEK